MEAGLRALELTVRRRLDGLLQGNHLGLVPGPGTEPGDARRYQPGDDVRRMDWAVTARTTEPHIRQTVADRELETWLVVDLSASLDFGTADCEKRDLAVAPAPPWPPDQGRRQPDRRRGRHRRAADADPARGGQPHARGLIRRIAEVPRAPGAPAAISPAALEQLRRPPRRRGLAVVISDFLGRRSTGSGRCARCPAGTTCSPSRCSTRATWSCPTSAPWCSPTRRPAGRRRS